MRHPSRGLAHEAGITLIELIVYIAVGSLLVSVIAGLFISSWQADATTRDRDAATGAAQIVTASLQTSIRNASAFDTDGNLLRGRVATGTSGWECRAWRLANPLSIAGQNWYELQYNHGNSAISAGSTGWTNLLGGPTGGRKRVLVQGNPTPDKPFTREGDLLAVSLRVTVVDIYNRRPESAVVPISANVVRQAAGEGSPSTCS